MATITGNDGVVLIGSDVIAEVRSFSITETAEQIEDTVLGDTNRTYKAGMSEVSGTISCYFDDSDTNGQEAMDVGSSVSLVLRPEGTGTGLANWSVTATILEASTEVNMNEIVTRDFNWSASGSLTKATQ